MDGWDSLIVFQSQLFIDFFDACVLDEGGIGGNWEVEEKYFLEYWWRVIVVII